jgi:hypothetical protein
VPGRHRSRCTAQATQIADRWHLLRNLAEKLDEFLSQKRPILLKAAPRPPTEPETEGDENSLTEGSAENPYVKILVLPDLSHPTDHGLHTPTARADLPQALRAVGASI